VKTWSDSVGKNPGEQVEKEQIEVSADALKLQTERPRMQADYSKQLTEIVSALNRPAMPTWIVALIGAGIGALLTFSGQMLIRFVENSWEIRKFRRVLYRDIAAMFFAVAHAEHFNSEKDAREVIGMELHFDAEEFLKRDQKIYMQLSERVVANEIYARLHQVLPTEHSVRSQAYGAAVHIARQIWDRKLKVKQFKRFLDKPDLQTLLTQSKEIYDDYNQQAATMEKRIQK
jgi:hypothetical protein